MDIDIVDADGPIEREIVGLERLRAALPNDWFAYANREIITGKKQTAEIDLIVISSDRIFAIDLKDWNGVLHAEGGRWIQNNVPKGRSASKKVRDNARKIGTYLRSRLPKRVGSTFVDGFVVMTAKLDYSSLPESDRDVILNLDEFCALSDPRTRAKVLEPVHRPPGGQKLTEFRTEFDLIFRVGSAVKPRVYRPFGYEVDPNPITVHRSGLYKEFVGTSETLEKGVVRNWTFSALPLEVQELTARRELLSREQHVREFLAAHSDHFETDDVVVKRLLCDDHIELFEYPRGMERLAPYLGKHRQKLSYEDRVDKFKAIVSTVASMHEVECSHTDIGMHSLWIGAGTRHKLSNFASAQYPSTTTLGPLRFLLSNVIEKGSDSNFDPRQADVRSLGKIGKELFKEDTHHELSSTQRSAFIDLIDKAAGADDFGGLTDAKHFLSSLNAADRRLDANGAGFDVAGVLQRVLTPVVPFVTYVPTGNIRTRGEEISYQSMAEGRVCVVKVWTSLNSHASKEKLYSVLSQFLKVAQVKDSLHPSFPRIVDGGVGPAGAFIAYQFEEGESLNVARLDALDALAVANELVTVVAAAHEVGLSHGDLSPTNVIIRWGEGDPGIRQAVVRLIDFVQVNVESSAANQTPKYAPIVRCDDPFQRDAYAVVKICVELLQECANKASLPGIEAAVTALGSEMVDGWQRSPVAIARVRAILANAAKPSSVIDRLCIPVATRAVSSLLEPDGDIYYLNFRQAKGPHQPTFFVNGLKEYLQFPLDSDFRVMADQARLGSVDSVRLNLMRSFSKPWQIAKGISIEMVAGRSQSSIPRAQEVLQLWLERARNETSAGAGGEKQVVAPVPERGSTAHGTRQPQNRTEVWSLFAEAEDRVRLEVTSTGSSHESEGVVIVPVTQWQVPVKARSVAHVVYRINKREDEVEIGELDLGLSSKQLIAIRGAENDGYERGVKFVIKNGLEESARVKKVSAANRLIADKGARAGLLEEFNRLARRDLNDQFQPILARLQDSDLERYGLNGDQRKAVLGAVNGNGLFLLQGPPGTGKTRTIAALVHAVVTKLNSRRVLVASQTHEAVDNAAVTIAEVFREYGTPLDLVRVGDEDDVADELISVHTAALRRDFISMLDAEWVNRLAPIGRELGLEDREIEDLLWLHQYVLAVLVRASSWERDLRETSSDGSRSKQLREEAAEAFKSKVGATLDELCSFAAAQQAAAHWVGSRSPSASPAQCAKFLAIVSAVADTLLRLRSEKSDSTFGEFLVKTRAVACGTCVGIGSAAYKLSDKVFDWVIVDEAARCTPTELAVALQSARRVILVGDHKQLAPFITGPIRKYLQRCLRSDNVSKWLSSDFQEMFDETDEEARVCSSLWDQYRMVEPISRMVSDLVYGSRLVCKKEAEEHWLSTIPSVGNAAVTLIDTEGLGDAAFDDQPEESTSYFNAAEANAIVSLIESITRDPAVMNHMLEAVQRNDEAPIGIICTYSAQVELIDKLFHDRDLEHLIPRVVKLGTVDSYQGRENLIVVVSLVRSGPSHAIGHVDALERVNVAFSRAKERLVIVGDGRTWSSQKTSSYLVGQAWRYVVNRLNGTGYQRVPAIVEMPNGADHEHS